MASFEVSLFHYSVLAAYKCLTARPLKGDRLGLFYILFTDLDGTKDEFETKK
jgi:hypothetical protein